jgi:FtsP/CotA-like multicopper oxidase with cupredoxin domain
VRPVEGSRFPLAPGQRLDLLLTMPASGGVVPVLAQREGDRARTGFILATPSATVSRVAGKANVAAKPAGMSLEERLVASSPLTPRPVDVAHRIVLGGQMMPYVWSIDERTWTKHRPLHVRTGQRVVVDMVNRSAMAHPMHLHGHHFQVAGLNGKRMQGAMRDTVLVPVSGSVRIAFDAGAPGRFLLHCHNLFHMASGMMTEVVCAA